MNAPGKSGHCHVERICFCRHLPAHQAQQMVTGHFQNASSHCMVLFQVRCLWSQFLSGPAVPQGGNPITQCMLLLICPGAPDPALRSPAARWHLTCLCFAALCDVDNDGIGSLLAPKNNTADGNHAPAYGLDQSCFSNSSCNAF